MRTIPQQGAGEVKGGGGAENKAIKALFSQIRDVSAMVNVGMGEYKGGDLCGLEGKIQVSFTALLAPSLEKAAIKLNFLIFHVKHVHGTRCILSGAMKLKTHLFIHNMLLKIGKD
jgi:hypothetical protein